MLTLVRRLLFLCLVFSACARGERSENFRVRIGGVGPLEPLAPALVSGFSNFINPLVFQALVSPVHGQSLNSAVLADLQRLDRTRYRFHLSRGTAFSDGTAIAASDVLRALNGAGSLVPREDWLELELHEPGHPLALLGAVVARTTQFGVFGTGPFTIVSQDSHTILLRRRSPAPGRIAEVELASFPTPREAFAALLRGEVNMVVLPGEAELELLSGVRTLKAIRSPGLHSLTLLFNAQRLDRTTRRALTSTIDPAAVTTAFGGSCRPRPPGIFQTELAAGSALEIATFDAFQGFRPAALAVRRVLQVRGGEVVPVTANEAVTRGGRHDFDLMLIPAQTWPPELALSRWVTGDPENWGGYSNRKFDEAFRAGDFVRAQAELEADPPAAFICDLDRTAVVDARLKNATLGDYDLLDTLPDWEVTP
jgi:ABC-type transport system substrate-binding protein